MGPCFSWQSCQKEGRYPSRITYVLAYLSSSCGMHDRSLQQSGGDLDEYFTRVHFSLLQEKPDLRHRLSKMELQIRRDLMPGILNDLGFHFRRIRRQGLYRANRS